MTYSTIRTPSSVSETPVDVIIDWQHPEPRNALERFAGPGATSAEKALQIIFPPLAAGVFAWLSVRGDWGWQPWQLAVALLLMFDIVGGIITNATSTAKRWYHRAGQTPRDHLGFVALHLLQPLLLYGFFMPSAWSSALWGFAYVMIAAIIIVRMPLYLQRPGALLMLMGSVFLTTYVLVSPPYFAWFWFGYYTKLLVSHLLREEPYRPHY